MLGFQLRIYLYFIDNNHVQNVDLMFFSVIQFDCAYMTHTERQGHR